MWCAARHCAFESHPLRHANPKARFYFKIEFCFWIFLYDKWRGGSVMNRKRRSIIGAVAVIGVSAYYIFFHSDSSLRLTKEAIYALVSSNRQSPSITWSDFEQYPHKDVGSGNYVYEYLLTDGSKFYLIGNSLSEKPMYVYILNAKGGREDLIPHPKA